jgi:hypothetical protein
MTVTGVGATEALLRRVPVTTTSSNFPEEEACAALGAAWVAPSPVVAAVDCAIAGTAGSANMDNSAA